jgi:stress-induced morphogen
MTKTQILDLVKQKLSNFQFESLEISELTDDSFILTVVSNEFQNIRLMNRINIVGNLLITDDFSPLNCYTIIINPVTLEEVIHAS